MEEKESMKEETTNGAINDLDLENQPLANASSDKTSDEAPYSILTSREKYAMIVMLSCGGIWSTLSSSIYFPALPILSEKFEVSASIVNVSVVAYLLFQGITPSLLAVPADAYGRRPFIISCLLCYAATCVGLSRTNVYWLLAFLRCVQAASISPIIAISGGVVGDICTRAERGSYVGIMGGIQLVGQGFGALVGSGVVSGFGWRGVFVFLAIGSGAALIVVTIMMPETNRKIVGNLSVPPKRIINKSPATKIWLRSRLTNDVSTIAPPTSIDMLGPYKIFFQKKVFFSLLPAGFQFTTWTMSLTTLSTSLEAKYGFSVIKVGLCYLAPGMGTLFGAIFTGKLLDFIYARRKAAYDKKYEHIDPSNRPPFDIFTTRIQFVIYPTILLIMFSVVFGWCLQNRVNLAPILISAFVISFCAVAFMSSLNTLLVDMFPGQSSAATSCLNLMRCLLGAAGVGALQSMVDAMGEGGTYTLMAGFCLLTSGLFFYLAARGRKKREAEQEQQLQDAE
ncbi:multidrug resistance transporter [Scheffersomyces xylosifermentans]|uniref:multidrug resistance transporter n=1 Tax=Scheffersomyces xylosifermentans TaxID=1304137 RepID=UPI00315CAB59